MVMNYFMFSQNCVSKKLWDIIESSVINIPVPQEVIQILNCFALAVLLLRMKFNSFTEIDNPPDLVWLP